MTLVVGAMILLSLALLGAVVYLVYSYATMDRLRVAVHVKVPERPVDVWGPRLFSIAVLVGLVIGSSYYVGRPAFCANCHSDRKEAKALAQSAHKDVPCL